MSFTVLRNGKGINDTSGSIILYFNGTKKKRNIDLSFTIINNSLFPQRLLRKVGPNT